MPCSNGVSTLVPLPIAACCRAQAKWKAKITSPEYLAAKAAKEEEAAAKAAEEAAVPLHEANDWGISCDGGDEEAGCRFTRSLIHSCVTVCS